MGFLNLAKACIHTSYYTIVMVSKKGNISQFNIVIYPVDFVVVIGDFEDEVNELYRPFEEEYKDLHISPPSTTGSTYRVKEKSTGIACILVWIKKVEEFTDSIVAHECTHAALEIWSYIGSEVSLDNQEPFCYLVGNLVRLAVGCYYEIPGIEPPKVSQDAFCNPQRPKTAKTKKAKKSKSRKNDKKQQA